ncbi:hypothetical protein C0995_003897 [Termitomyces sp. Mi166|nr:hypothetical protein C0995_003897 [Termitomyces sp. Mi166\
MSFLQRSRSLGPNLFSSSSEHALPAPIPFPPGSSVENIRVPSRPHVMTAFAGRRNPAGTIIRRVSAMISKSLPKKPSAFVSLNVKAPPESRWKVNEPSSPTESVISFDDIRRPSGLGRAVSVSSDHSLPPSPFTTVDKDLPFHFATENGHERTRALSSPTSLWSTEALDAHTMRRSASTARRNKDRPPPPVPLEVVINIMTFAPRHAITSLALTSSDWCSAARLILYETLDLRTLQPKQVELLVTLLAYRHDLADLVRSFECHTWPDFFPPSSNLDEAHTPHPSFSPALTAVFTIAFQNMHLITSLVLPSFDHTFLRHHSAFGLRKLTILSHTMTSDETTQLFAWLDGQTNITHLEFPNLLDLNDTDYELLTISTIPINSLSPKSARTNYSNIYSASTPVLTPSESSVSSVYQLHPASPFNSPSLLPALTILVATPSIINSLTANRHVALSRPLQHVTVNINNTLYTGLRPSSLLTPLRGITSLVLQFSNAVDRRTIVKVLGAGAVLATPSALSSSVTQTLGSIASSSRKALLRSLELRLSDSSTGTDQALYKAISASISRYQGLVNLSCCFASPEVASKAPPLLTDYENDGINVWTKQCPSLRTVTLLSRAAWKHVEES